MRRFIAVLLLFAVSAWCSEAMAFNAAELSGLGAVVKGGEATIGFASSGVPLLTTADKALSAGGGWAQAGNFGVASGATAADGLVMAANGSVQLAGNVLPIHAAMNIPVLAVFAAATTALSLVGGWPGLLIGASPLLLQWIEASGGSINSAGQLMISNPAICTTAPCYEYQSNNSGTDQTPATVVTSYTPSATCALPDVPADAYYNGSQNWHFVANSASAGGGNCLANSVNQAGSVVGTVVSSITVISVPPAASNAQPGTLVELEPAMEASPLNPALLDELAQDGAPIADSPWTVTGPATVDSPTTTTTNPDGSTDTDQKTTPYTYAGPDVTAGPTTDTTTATPPTGAASGATSTTTTTTTDPSQTQDQTPVGTPMPGIPNLYTQKYPQGLAGVWSKDSDALQNMPLMSLPAQLMPSIPDGGSCPTFPVSLDFAQWANFGNVDFAPPCSIWPFCQAIIMITALFVARGIIFGG